MPNQKIQTPEERDEIIKRNEIRNKFEYSKFKPALVQKKLGQNWNEDYPPYLENLILDQKETISILSDISNYGVNHKSKCVMNHKTMPRKQMYCSCGLTQLLSKLQEKNI